MATAAPGYCCLTPNDSAEETYKAWMTIRLIILLLECALVELAVAERADEVVRVVLAVHGRDAAAGDWLVAAGTE